jgi:HD superfamily phosphohydrolase/NAD-dependent SIR2 family protein deacetylase
MAGLVLTEDLPRIAARLRKQHDDGLIPLFVIGAGVSNSDAVAHVPTFEQMLDRLRALIEVEDPALGATDRSFRELLNLIREQGPLGWDDSVVVTRVLMEAQDSPSRIVQECWQKFSNWLLWECLVSTPQGRLAEASGIVHAQPTPGHAAIANLCGTIDALCLSLNFDGLTRRALRDAGFARALILSESDEIERFFLRSDGEGGARHEELVAVVKLRGDAFMVACQRTGCPLYNRPIPLWDLADKNLQARDPRHLECQACRHPRKIGISFPGVADKEAVTERMLLALLQYASLRVGSIFVIGLSGRWDRSVANFISRLSRVRRVPLYVVRRNPDNDRVFRGVISSMQGRANRASGYFADTADHFLSGLAKAVAETDSPVHEPITLAAMGVRIHSADDRFWLPELQQLRPVRTADLSELEHQVIGHEHFARLSNIAQLGLKNYWLDVESYETASVHNRRVHSLGVMHLASAVYLTLRDHRVSSFKSARLLSEQRPPREHYLLRLGALLHDVGHMPFSHMLEEVFEELSWVLHADVSVFRHTDYSSQLVREICSSPTIAHLLSTEYGYEADDVISVINGAFGIHYLDALIDSAVDVDKVDYVFRDSHVCKWPTTLMPRGDWLRRLLSSEDLAVSPEGFLKLGGEAASLYLHLLQARQHLYESFYLSRLIRFPEALTRFLLVLCLTARIVPSRLRLETSTDRGLPQRDLGRAKILEAQRYLFELAENAPRDPLQHESRIAEGIVAELEGSALHPRILEALGPIANVIRTRGVDELERLYADHIVGEPLVVAAPVATEALRKVSRDVMLRKPGSIVIDVTRPTSFLSASRRRQIPGAGRFPMEQDCVLVPQQNPEFWKAGDPATRPLSAALRSLAAEQEKVLTVSIFRVSPNDNYARQARDLFLSLLRQENIL